MNAHWQKARTCPASSAHLHIQFEDLTIKFHHIVCSEERKCAGANVLGRIVFGCSKKLFVPALPVVLPEIMAKLMVDLAV